MPKRFRRTSLPTQRAPSATETSTGLRVTDEPEEPTLPANLEPYKPQFHWVAPDRSAELSRCRRILKEIHGRLVEVTLCPPGAALASVSSAIAGSHQGRARKLLKSRGSDGSPLAIRYGVVEEEFERRVHPYQRRWEWRNALAGQGPRRRRRSSNRPVLAGDR